VDRGDTDPLRPAGQPLLPRAAARRDPHLAGRPVDREALRGRGIGITNVAARATARADELTPEELRRGGERLRDLVAERQPDVVAIAGITAYRSAFGERHARVGEQPDRWGGTRVFVVPNPSGLNAHETVDSLAQAYAAAARAAGVICAPPEP
jgi:double-stranded uracil-DNA glycosylase